MKRFFLLLAVAVIATACYKEGWGDNKLYEYGVFSFSESRTVVEVTPQTKSFRLEGSYVEMPREKYAGQIPVLVTDESTAENALHYRFNNGTVYRFSQGQTDKDYYLDIELIPANIDRELQIIFFAPTVTTKPVDKDEFPDRTSTTTIILRPAAAQQ